MVFPGPGPPERRVESQRLRGRLRGVEGERPGDHLGTGGLWRRQLQGGDPRGHGKHGKR